MTGAGAVVQFIVRGCTKAGPCLSTLASAGRGIGGRNPGAALIARLHCIGCHAVVVVLVRIVQALVIPLILAIHSYSSNGPCTLWVACFITGCQRPRPMLCLRATVATALKRSSY